MLLLEFSTAFLAYPHLLPFGADFMSNAGRLAAFRADKHYVGYMYRSLDGRDSTLRVLLCGPEGLLHYIELLNHYTFDFGYGAKDLSFLARIFAGDDFDRVALFHVEVVAHLFCALRLL